MNKCVFLDRDGVLNVEKGNYVYKPEDFEIEYQVPEAIGLLKNAGFLVVVVTNQAGIAKKLYTASDVKRCHDKLQQACNQQIDAFYFASGHPDVSASFSRKPGSLLFERAAAKYRIDFAQSWMVGDRERDITPAKKLGMKGVLISADTVPTQADHYALHLYQAVTSVILG